MPISGIGGIANWRDAAEFMALGATSVQVCTAIMHYGFRIVEDMMDGLNEFLDAQGLCLGQLTSSAAALTRHRHWEELEPELQAGRGDRLRQLHRLQPVLHRLRGRRAPVHRPGGPGPMAWGRGGCRAKPIPKISEDDCVGCNLCSLVCPVDDCITMVPVDTGKTP